MMIEASDQLGNARAVPLHPKPMVLGGGIFGEDGGEPTLR